MLACVLPYITGH